VAGGIRPSESSETHVYSVIKRGEVSSAELIREEIEFISLTGWTFNFVKAESSIECLSQVSSGDSCLRERTERYSTQKCRSQRCSVNGSVKFMFELPAGPWGSYHTRFQRFSSRMTGLEAIVYLAALIFGVQMSPLFITNNERSRMRVRVLMRAIFDSG
jgi:short subunit dehydrogenase-like uncharacterized protein